ncbi:Mariner Mos1 transposase-like 1 [Homarus americanus]|uniref:Mariner Mos1 transposase-like 1 n=1 Tax=Homarus americanus TaxID=6706 RepID=A0A8J5N6J2_HOMAM|nr:Mariner Mos1 transposase-like 1 [Homarus americanus]
MTTLLSLRDQRVVVKYLYLKKIDPTEIHKQLMAVCGEGTTSYKVIRDWIQDFQDGREDLMDQCQRCVGSNGGVNNGAVAPTDPAIVVRLEELINSDRRVTLEQASEMVNVTQHTSQMIITNVLGLKRVCERWVPRLLTPEQRQTRIATCQELVDRYEAEGDEFLTKIVTGDETYVTYYMPERRTSSVNKFPSSHEKAKVFQSKFRVLYAIYYDIQGLLLAHPVPDQTQMTSEYYAYLLRDLLVPAIKRKRRGPAGKDREIILLQENTALHNTKVTQVALRDLNIETLPHSPDSPDLLPSEYWLYPHLKEQIKGSSFKDRSSTWSAIHHHTNSFTENELAASIRKLPDRWNRVIDFSGGLHIL